MTHLVKPGAGFAELFRTFESSAWRLETLPAYEVDEERASFERFVRTGDLDVGYLAGWLSDVRAATEAGKRFERVRVVVDPPTDYLRFEMAVAAHNIRAGEEIRVLPDRGARSLGLPERHDFWIFDDRRVAILHMSPTGRLLDVEVKDDEATLARHRAWQALAWERASPVGS
ncbi:DUF6879 family protein [Amycolatopsis minnesotensis]|uniref:DUF6879 domain-containing protein n=1 Tax=Amycolatopsis minnesotensis TaxID=337894 RepID=A0ABP5BHM8_9PSEU